MPGVVKVKISGCEDKESGSSWSLEVEGDASLIYAIVRRFVECLPYPRSWVESIIAKISLPGGTEDRYIVSWYAGPQGSILIYTGGPGSPLARLLDPMRGEGLVEVDKNLYMDERLAECLSKGGKCRRIRVERYRGWEETVYTIAIKGVRMVATEVSLLNDHIIFDDLFAWGHKGTVVIRVVDAGVSIPLAAVVNLARALNTELSMKVSMYEPFAGEIHTYVFVYRGVRKHKIEFRVYLSGKNELTLDDWRFYALLYVLACLAKATSIVGVKVCWSSS